MRSPDWPFSTPRGSSESTSTPRESDSARYAEEVVVLCDPDEVRRERLRTFLHKNLPDQLPLFTLESVARLNAFCETRTPLAVVVPWSWPGARNGTDPGLLPFIRAHHTGSAILVFANTNRLPIGIHCQALAAGAKQILNDQAESFPQDLSEAVARQVRGHQARLKEQQQLEELFSRQGLIGHSPTLREAYRRAIKASHFSDLPVLLLGETGTGKQRFAEAIHALDPVRNKNPFIAVNCSAINKTLAESTLFGHVKGAFSGANEDRLGLFRAAEGGTLMLDEIGEIDPELQPKLLRVLQERKLLPVGEDYEYPVNVRVIAATNRCLRDMVAEGKFREDLYQRLNVFQLRLPPLRERPEDVEAQARHFLHECRDSIQGCKVNDIDPLVVQALRVLPWEGNTRQLRNFVWEVLTQKESGTVVQMEDLPSWVLDTLAQAPAEESPGEAASDAPPPAASSLGANPETLRGLTLTQAVEEYEYRLLKASLERNRGNRTKTAAELGLTPRSIFNKIKKYGLE